MKIYMNLYEYFKKKKILKLKLFSYIFDPVSIGTTVIITYIISLFFSVEILINKPFFG